MRRIARLKRTASWVPLNGSMDIMQILTDAMAYGSEIQMNYNGWRLVEPYGWHVSKDGNYLVMCYNEDMDIRSFRYDKIQSVLVDENILSNEDQENVTFDEFNIPEIPDLDNIMETTENEKGWKLPFDDALDIINEVPVDDNVEDSNNEFNNFTDNSENTQNNKDNINQDNVNDENSDDDNSDGSNYQNISEENLSDGNNEVEKKDNYSFDKSEENSEENSDDEDL